MLHLNLLGGFNALLDNGDLLQFQTDKARALLAYLAIQRGQAVPRALLAEMFWSDRHGKKAQVNLRKALHRLRQGLGEHSTGLFIRVPRAIQLNSAEITTDLFQFESLLDQVEQHYHQNRAQCASCLQKLTAATELYTGELLAGLIPSGAAAFNDWLTVERERLHQRVLFALHTLSEIELERSLFVQAQRHAMRQIALEPWRETAYGQLMIALARQGQPQAAYKQFDLCRAVLNAELGIAPSLKLRNILADIRDHQYDPPPNGIVKSVSVATTLIAPRHNLPATTTPFFDRTSDQQRLENLLQDPLTRWVTLLGAGGVGKSRLSQQVGRALVEKFKDGVWFVPLAGLDSVVDDETAQRRQIATVIASTLGLPLMGVDSAEIQLTNYLQNKQLLLILDNFEHLTAGASLVNTLLQRAEQIAVLCTSRIALQFRGEYCLQLKGLSVPDGAPRDGNWAERWRGYPSLQLFADCARRVLGGFDLTVANMPVIANICRWVGGNALGIELAASWMRHKSAETIYSELQQSYTVLRSRLRDIPARQRSMQTIFEQSWELLTAAEQQTMAHLSVFRGGFEAMAAEAIVGADRLDLFDLVDKSLLSQQNGRFVMHEALRQFSAEQRTKISPIKAKHSQYFLQLLENHTAALQQDAPQVAAAEIDRDYDNIAAAWQTGLHNQTFHTLASATRALSHYYQMRGRSLEAEAIFAEAARLFKPHAHHDEQAKNALALALVEQARFLNRLSRYEGALQVAREASQLEEGGWTQKMGRIISAEAHWRLNRLTQATASLQQAEPLLENDTTPQGWYFFHRGIIADLRHEPAVASDYLQKALRIWCIRKDRRRQQMTLNSLGLVALNQPDLPLARTYFGEALTIAEALGDRSIQPLLTCNLGCLELELGNVEQADALLTRSLQSAKRTNNLALSARAHHFLALAKQQQENDQAAQTLARTAVQQYELIGLEREANVVAKAFEFG